MGKPADDLVMWPPRLASLAVVALPGGPVMWRSRPARAAVTFLGGPVMWRLRLAS